MHLFLVCLAFAHTLSVHAMAMNTINSVPDTVGRNNHHSNMAASHNQHTRTMIDSVIPSLRTQTAPVAIPLPVAGFQPSLSRSDRVSFTRTLYNRYTPSLAAHVHKGNPTYMYGYVTSQGMPQGRNQGTNQGTNPAYMYNTYQGQPGSSYTYHRNTRTSQLTINNYQGNTRNSMSNYLPLMLGSEQGRQLATYNMLLHSKGNNMFPFYVMSDGEHREMLPFMSLMNRENNGGRGINHLVMSVLAEQYS